MALPRLLIIDIDFPPAAGIIIGVPAEEILGVHDFFGEGDDVLAGEVADAAGAGVGPDAGGVVCHVTFVGVGEEGDDGEGEGERFHGWLGCRYSCFFFGGRLLWLGYVDFEG